MIARGFSFSFLLIPSIMTAELQFTTNSHSCASLTNLSRSREDAQRDFTFGILSRKIRDTIMDIKVRAVLWKKVNEN